MKFPEIQQLLSRCAQSQGVWAFLSLFAVGICYFPAATGPFFFDDEHFIVKNQMVHSLSHVADIYKSSVTEGASIKGNFYRPNQQLIYALIYQVVGASTPVPYHVASFLLHAINGILFQAWLILLGFAVPAAGLMALLFLMHPAQTEAVSYISGLADPLALTFLLGGLLWYGKTLNRQNRHGTFWAFVPSVLCFGLALLSKENAVVFAPLALATSILVAIRTEQRIARGEWLSIVMIGSIAAIYIGLRLTALNFAGGIGLTNEANVYTQSLVMRLITFISVLWDYAVLIFFPKDLFYEKPYVAYQSLLSLRGVFGLSALVFIAIALARVRKHPEMAFGCFLFSVGLLPYTGIVPLNAMFLEHWLYVPLLGVAVLVVHGLSRVPKGIWSVGTGVFLAFLLVFCGARTWARSGEWADIEKFYLNELAHGGSSMRIYNNLGMYYADQQDATKAISYYRLAVDAAGSVALPQPHHNLARVYFASGKTNEAIAELRLALAIDPRFSYSLSFLREIFVVLKDDLRTRLCDQALTLVMNGQPYDVQTFNAQIFDQNSR